MKFVDERVSKVYKVYQRAHVSRIICIVHIAFNHIALAVLLPRDLKTILDIKVKKLMYPGSKR